MRERENMGKSSKLIILIMDGEISYGSLSTSTIWGNFIKGGGCYYHDMRNRLTIMSFFFNFVFVWLFFYGLEDYVRN